MICARLSWRLLKAVAAVMFLAVPWRFGMVLSAEPSKPVSPPRNSPTEGSAPTGTVTIQARREREIKHQIDKFISGAVFTYSNDSLERWDTPICPLVAGLPKERGEFILGRLSQIARDSHAPLGPEHCQPNLYVVVTDTPDLLLKLWSKRDRRMFNTCNGIGYLKEFLHSRQPVRVYYNARFSSVDGDRTPPAAIDVRGLQFDSAAADGCVASGAAGSRLRYGAVQRLTSVIMVVDSTRTINLTMGQLADYISMVGLAQIRVEADTGTAPSILRVFRETDPQLRVLSPWDKAFLYSLYTTSQSSVLEVTMIKRHMFEQIAAH